MRTSHLTLALPALATAQQFPLLDQINQITDQVKGFFSQATSTISSAVPSSAPAVSMPDPVASGAAKVAEAKVQRLTLDNHQAVLTPGLATSSPGGAQEEWMIYVTGANKTCFGMCERANKAWIEAVPLIAASPSAPNLAYLDCESDPVLCNAWAVGPPEVLHFLLPQPQLDQSSPASTVRNVHVNHTTVTASEIAAVHLQDKYKDFEPYEGFWHPFDGPLAKYGLAIPVGYFIWGASKIPSWGFMVGISFLSRTLMSRRMQPQPRGQAGAGAPAAAQ